MGDGATWQARARLILERAQAVLWSDAGDVGRAYLQARSLQEGTLRAWGLGWCLHDVFDPPERWELTGKRIYVPRGVVIPHCVGDKLWTLKVRRFTGDAPATVENGDQYGSIVEEPLLRWGVMALFVWIGWRVAQRGRGLPTPALVWMAIILAALLCGVLFGWLFWRRNLETAMVAHAAGHVGFFLINVVVVLLNLG